MSKRRPPYPPQAPPSQGIGLAGLFLVGFFVTLLVMLFRIFFGHIELVPDLTRADGTIVLLTYYAMGVILLTPLSLLFTMDRAPLQKTGWDRAFFLATSCLYLYVLVLLGFAVAISAALFGALPGLDLSALKSNTLFLGAFWLALFAAPPIFMNGPTVVAAHAEKHGLARAASGGMGHIGFGLAAAVGAYVFVKFLPLALSNPLILVLEGCALMLAVIAVWSGLLFGRLFKDFFGWALVTLAAAGGVVAVAIVFNF